MKLYIRNVWVIKFLSIWIDPILSTVIWEALVGQIIQTLKWSDVSVGYISSFLYWLGEWIWRWSDVSRAYRHTVFDGYTISKPQRFGQNLLVFRVTSIFTYVWVTPLLFSALEVIVSFAPERVFQSAQTSWKVHSDNVKLFGEVWNTQTAMEISGIAQKIRFFGSFVYRGGSSSKDSMTCRSQSLHWVQCAHQAKLT